MTHVRHLALLALLAVGTISAHAQDSADITINFEVAEVRFFEAPGGLSVDLVLDTYDHSLGFFLSTADFTEIGNVAYNGSANQKVTIKLDGDMPVDLSLDADGTFAGNFGYAADVSSIEQDLITGIAGPFSGTAEINFYLWDDSDGTILPAQIGSRICTITMMDE